MAKKGKKKKGTAAKKPLLKLTQKDLNQARGGTTCADGGSGDEGYDSPPTYDKFGNPLPSILRAVTPT